MELKMIKAGFIGAGSVAKIHKIGIDCIEDVSVVSIVKNDNNTLVKRSAELGISNFHTSIDSMLSDPSIDVIHCLLPNNLHYSLIKSVINSGKHFIAEKPLTVSVDEGTTLVELADMGNIVCGINFRYRYYPAIQYIRNFISDGKLGEIYMLHGAFLQDWLSMKTDYNWRLIPEIGGRSAALADIGSHWLDLVQYVIGQRISRVFSHLKTIIPHRKYRKNEWAHVKLDDYAMIMFETDKGIPGSVLASQVATGHSMSHCRIEIVGSRKSIAWNREKPLEVWIGQRGKTEKYIHFSDGHNGWESGVCNLTKNFYNDVRAQLNGSPSKKKFNYPLLEDGLNTMKIVDAALESLKMSSWINIEYKDL